MENVIIVIILIVVVAFGIKETIKHFKGEGACCGGAKSSKPKKLKNKIINVYTFQIEGMHCKNCANAVMGVINDIEGASAKVSLNKKIAKVSCDREIDPKIIEDAICKRGYEAKII